MNYVKGNITKVLFSNESNNYTLALFRVKETDVEEIKNKSIKISGILPDITFNRNLKLTGFYEENIKYKTMQFNIKEFGYYELSKEEEIKAFLLSDVIKGCGPKTADLIYNAYKEKSIEKIKDLNNLLILKGMTQNRAIKINNSILEYSKYDEFISFATNMGFNMEDLFKIIKKHKIDSMSVLINDIYSLKDIISFSTLDYIYLNKNNKDSEYRVYYLILETLNMISNSEGHIYYFKEDVLKNLQNYFNIEISNELFDETIDKLLENNKIHYYENKYYLYEYFHMEKDIAKKLYKLSSNNEIDIKNFNSLVKKLENEIGIIYDHEQLKAIKQGLTKNITIISGGPGTGKTTILKAIVKIYEKLSKKDKHSLYSDLVLLAPTGRASKKMNEATDYPSSTIHRFLKWNKTQDSFEFNIDNKVPHKLVILDEASMVDLKLFSSLLDALNDDVRLILVGDYFQLPSVGPGSVLNDLINSDMFNFINLTTIYRQSENSYIPYLANDIKNKIIEEHMLAKKDDYNFISTSSDNLINVLTQVIKASLTKNISEADMQILIPMYKGINGIDNINKYLRNIYNQKDGKKAEIKFNDIIYRVNDKVLQLINDPENNVFNGDVGFIKSIYNNKITIDFNDNLVVITKSKLINIKHAYAISIHKSQGSEFNHVIIPILNEQSFMLYNKLIYTAISRAKQSLVLLGSSDAFQKGILNDYSKNRQTTLKENIEKLLQ